MQKKYWFLLLIHFVLIALFAFSFHYNFTIIFQHLHACFVIVFLLNIIENKISNRLLCSFFNAFFAILFSSFYISIFLSNNAYQQTVNIPLIAAFVKDFEAYNSIIPLSAQIIISIFVLIFLIVTFLFYKANRKSSKLTNKPKTNLLLLGLWLFSAIYLIWKKRDYQKAEEPIITMLFGDTSSSIFMTKKRADIGLQDLKEKASYSDTLRNKRNLIIILVDALRAENTSVYGYRRNTTPFLQELYHQNKIIKIPNAVASCACSECGVASLLFSKNWANIGYNGFSLVGLLQKTGFQTHFVLSGYSKNWSPIYDFFKTDLNSYSENEGGYALGDDESVIYGLKHLKIDTSKPQFLYLHLMSAHKVGIKHKKFEKYKPTMMMRNLAKTTSDFEKVFNYYDNGVIQADSYVQRIFDILNEKNILKNSTVIICADHADALGEHGETGHVTHLYNAVNRIPVFVYDNNFSLYKNTAFWRQIDIAPTIADRLGLKIPDCWQGKSALQYKIDTFSFHQTSVKRNPKYAIIKYTDTAIYKLLFDKNLKNLELFDIKKDSSELNNLVENKHLQSLKTELIQKIKKDFDKEYE